MASRKSKMDPVRVQVFVSPATYAAIAKIAAHHDKSISLVTATAIERGLFRMDRSFFAAAGRYQKKGFAKKDLAQ